MQDNGMWYAGDDYDYFAQSSWIVFGQYPSYKHEYFTAMPQGPKRSVGPGLLATPFVFIGSLIDRFEKAPIFVERNYNTIAGSWSQFGFIISSVFYLCLGCLLLYWSCLYVVKPFAASWAVILMVICQGMPLYAFRRPIFSHATEFFLQSLMIYLFLRNAKAEGRFLDHWFRYTLVGALAAMIFLVRYNNVIIAVAWPLLFLSQQPYRGFKECGSRLLCIVIPFTVLVVLFKLIPEVYNNYHPYSDAFSFIRVHAGIGEMLKRLWNVFFGVDWGLVFTAPFLLLGVGALMKYKFPFKGSLWLMALPLSVNFYTIVFFGTQGGWYGYRYLIASAFPVFVIPLAVLIERWQERMGVKILWLLGILAVFPILSMLCFEGNESTTLHLIPQFFGRTDWSNDTYQIAVWKTLVHAHDFVQVVFKGGLYYISYICYVAKILPQHFNNYMNFLARYPCFEWKILLRVLIIYLMPFLVWRIFYHKRV